MLTIATVNVNGIRAAWRKGMPAWLEDRAPDIVTMQEVRATDDIVTDLFSGTGLELSLAEAEAKGRAGVAIASAKKAGATRVGIGEEYFATAGRWIENDYRLEDGSQLSVVSAYVHSGEAGTPKQDDKYRFLDRMLVRLAELREASDHVLVTGDLNVGHTELDIKNWRGNRKKAGFLPEERAYFDRFFGELGYVDVARAQAGEVEGPYTWWSNRGQAFDNDTGWRIDYHMASPELARAVKDATVDRAASYDTRWSDHAPLVVAYDVPGIA